MKETGSHDAVLLHEAVQALVVSPDGTYVDATYGRGGHSGLILQRLSGDGRLIVFDKDPTAIAHAQANIGGDARVQIHHASFALLGQVLSLSEAGNINGVLLDLGVSSPQLDDPARGFSFMRDGPLDMRMDNSAGLSAADWVNSAPETELSQVFKEYGEERHARRMARAIVAARGTTRIGTTKELAQIVAAANPSWEKGKHPATRVFQAIRIWVNRELDELHEALAQIPDLLAPKGRLVVISFHSLEDRIVKRFIREQEKGPALPRYLPLRADQIPVKMRSLIKAQRATDEEVKANVRARSAVLRVAEKVA